MQRGDDFGETKYWAAELQNEQISLEEQLGEENYAPKEDMRLA